MGPGTLSPGEYYTVTETDAEALVASGDCEETPLPVASSINMAPGEEQFTVQCNVDIASTMRVQYRGKQLQEAWTEYAGWAELAEELSVTVTGVTGNKLYEVQLLLQTAASPVMVVQAPDVTPLAAS